MSRNENELGDGPGRVCMHPPPTTPPNDIFLNLFDALNTNLHVNIENVGILTMAENTRKCENAVSAFAHKYKKKEIEFVKIIWCVR